VDFADYWITTDSASHTIADNTAVFSVSTVPVGAFTGNAKLSFDGVEEVTGLSAKLSATSVAIPGTATLTVTAASNTPPGTYPITIIANHGSVTRTVTSSLVVP
jgi:X-Pro dipeptidyl-peptidase